MSKLIIAALAVLCVGSMSSMSNRSESGSNEVQDDEFAANVVCLRMTLVCSVVVTMGMPS